VNGDTSVVDRLAATLEEAAQSLFAAASAGQAGPEAGAAGAASGASPQDDVVDAEFTEVRDEDKKS
jgi:molecular chaperone DnaK